MFQDILMSHVSYVKKQKMPISQLLNNIFAYVIF